MVLRCGLRHKFPYAFIESAIHDQIGTRAERSAYAFIFDRWPFSKGCWRSEIDFDFLINHVMRYAFLLGLFAIL